MSKDKTDAKGWAIKDYKDWIERAAEYLRSVTNRNDSNAHLIDEIACVEAIVKDLRRQNTALKHKVLDLAGRGTLTPLEEALLLN